MEARVMHKRTVAWLISIVAAGCGGTVTAPDSSGTPPSGDTDSGVVVDAPPAAPALAQGLPITGIAMFQAVKVDLVKGGARVDTPNAPVIAARPGMLRVYVTPDDTWSAREIEGELMLTAADGTTKTFSDKKTISAASTDVDTTSTFNFDLAAEAIATGVSYSVALVDHSLPATPDDRTDARYPTDGSSDDLGALDTTPTVKLVIVPVKYDADGSGRLPDVSDAQVQRYHDTLYKMYPTAQIEITVGEPLPWSTAISADGTGWDELMQAVYERRANDRAKKNVFYIGLFEPSASIGDYCSGGCVLGLAPLVPSSNDNAEQIALVVGYSGQLGPNTLNQELAHAMGREHAPCGGAAQIDRSFPYKRGGIGVWGYDVLKKTFVDPGGKARDFMGYCDPIWISDYTYKGLFDRIALVDKGARISAPKSQRSYRVVRVGAAGSLRLGSTVTLDEEPVGMEKSIEVVGKDARVTAGLGHYFPYDNLAGGLLLVDDDALEKAEGLRVEGLSVDFAPISR